MGEKPNWIKRFTVVEAAYSLAQSTGVGTISWYTASIFWSLGVTVAAYIWSELPWWGLAILFTGVAAFAAWGVSKGSAAYRDFAIAKAASNFDATEYRQFGKELLELAEEVRRLVTDRKREAPRPPLRIKTGKTSPSASGLWFTAMEDERLIELMVTEKYGARILRALALLKKLGVTLPFHFGSDLGRGPTISFIAMMGALLSEGNIQEAIAVSEDGDFIWQLR